MKNNFEKFECIVDFLTNTDKNEKFCTRVKM